MAADLPCSACGHVLVLPEGAHWHIEHVTDDHHRVQQSREGRMVTLRRQRDGTPVVWCDPEIADLVQALNGGGVPTTWSCSGHGHRPGVIGLADGRHLFIARDDEETREFEARWPVDINGDEVLP